MRTPVRLGCLGGEIARDVRVRVPESLPLLEETRQSAISWRSCTSEDLQERCVNGQVAIINVEITR